MADFASIAPQNNQTGKVFHSYFNVRWQNLQNIVGNTAFYNSMPPAWKQYYDLYIKQWDYWSKGFVPALHKGDFFSTAMGKTVCDILVRECMRGRFRFDGDTNATAFVAQWAKDTNFDDEAERGFRTANGIGNGILRLNVVAGGGDAYATVHGVDTCFFEVNRKGKIIRARFTDALTSNTIDDTNYFTVEDRCMFNGNPYYKVQIFLSKSTVTNPKMKPVNSLKQLKDAFLKSQFADTYGNIELDTWHRLPFDSLGCYNWKNTATSVAIGGMRGYSESSLHTALDILYSIDFNYSQQQLDMYWGRTQVLIPKTLQPVVVPMIHNGLSTGEVKTFYQDPPLADGIYTQIPSNGAVNDKPMQPIFIQPDMRGEIHKLIRDSDLELLASKVGLSSSDLANHLTYNNNAKTATQVNEEVSTTAITVNTKRYLAENAINEMLKDLVKFYGLKGEVNIVWNQDGLSNREDTLDEFSRGLLSKVDTIKMLHPELTEDEVQKRVTEIQAEQAARQQQQTMYGNAGDVFGVGDEY